MCGRQKYVAIKRLSNLSRFLWLLIGLFCFYAVTKSFERFHKKVALCKTANGNGNEARGVIVLWLRKNDEQYRQIVSSKWMPIERDCQYKIVFADDLTNPIVNHPEHLRKRHQVTAGDDGILELISNWMSVNHCHQKAPVFIGTNISTKSAIVQLNALKSAGVVEDAKHSRRVYDQFLDCAETALMSEREKDLFLLDKLSEGKVSVLYSGTHFTNDSPAGKISGPKHSEHLEFANAQPNHLCKLSGKIFMIRETWGNADSLTRNNVINIFVLGSSPDVNQNVKAELERYQDIIQGSFPDSYRQLTDKHRFFLKYLLHHCNSTGYKYVMKTDDDIVLDLDGIVSYMKALKTTKKRTFPRTFFCAQLQEEDRVPRNSSFKWYVTPQEYPESVYPPYCYGNLYMMSRDLIEPLYRLSLLTRDFWVDDVYFSGILPEILGNVTHAELPFQHPIYTKVVPPEQVLERKKWLVHTWQDEDVFDAYWFAFRGRYDRDIRREFVKGVRFRTGLNVSEKIFDAIEASSAVHVVVS